MEERGERQQCPHWPIEGHLGDSCTYICTQRKGCSFEGEKEPAGEVVPKEQKEAAGDNERDLVQFGPRANPL